MSTLPYVVLADDVTYTVVDDIAPVYGALLVGSVLDAITGLPVEDGLSVSTTLDGATIRTAEAGGLYAIAGYVSRVFPKLATQAYPVSLTVSAAGYADASFTVTVPIGAVLPVGVPTISLNPLNVRLQGRVVREVDRSPIFGARLVCVTPKVLLLRTPVYFSHAVGVTVNAVTLSAAGPTPVLQTAATPLDASITLTSTAGLAAGQILKIGSDITQDLAIVSALGPGANQVTLQTPLGHSYAAGTPAPAFSRTTGASAVLTRNVSPGDGVLSLSVALTADFVEIQDGAFLEYHALNAVSDAAGFYHFDGVGAVAALQLTASAGGFTSLTTTYSIAYGHAINILNFKLLP